MLRQELLLLRAATSHLGLILKTSFIKFDLIVYSVNVAALVHVVYVNNMFLF